MHYPSSYTVVHHRTPFPHTIVLPKSGRAVVTMSGGLDSTILAHILAKHGIRVTGVFVDYGQANRNVTYNYAQFHASMIGAELLRLPVDTSWSTASILTDRYVDEGITADNVYSVDVKALSWVPARNALIMLMAGGVASTNGIDAVYASFQADTPEWDVFDQLSEHDKSLFAGADLIPPFMQRLNDLAPFCYRTPITFRAPFADCRLDADQIYMLGKEYDVPMEFT